MERSRTTWPCVFVFGLLLPQLAAAEPTPAPPPAKPLASSLSGQAAIDYQAGRLLYDDRDYAGASVKFQRAYEHSRDPRLLWNVAASEKNLRHYAAVLDWLERYLREAGANMTASHRAEVDAVVETVRMLVSKVRLTVDQPGVSVSVDGTSVGTTPLPGPIHVELGRRTFRLSKSGFEDLQIEQDFAGGSETTLELAMQAEDDGGRLSVFASGGDTIRVDGQVVGHTQWTGSLPAGDHEVRVTREDMQPYVREVTVVAGEARAIYVTLEAIPSSIPTWVWIGAGALVAGGLATGGYFLFRSPERAGAELGTFGEVGL